MPLTNEQRKRKRKLERELADLRAEEGDPLTPAEIRQMSREEVEEHWERIRPTLANLGEAEEKPPTSRREAQHRASQRMSAGFDPDPAAVRRRRRRMDDEEGSDDDGDE